MKKDLLSIRRIRKAKAGETVLKDFYLELYCGEIVNLIGLEDSGQDELCSILLGDERIDSGEIRFMGTLMTKEKSLPVEQSNGIFYIGSNRLIISTLSVAENLYIIDSVKYFRLSISHHKMIEQAHQLFSQFGIDIDPSRKAGNLNRFEIYLLRLMRAYIKRARLIIIDDLIGNFSFDRTEKLAYILQRFRDEGMTILWLNSYPDYMTSIADRVHVIRDGKNAFTFYHGNFSEKEIISCMLEGRQLFQSQHEHIVDGKRVFEARQVANASFEDLNITCGSGECVGIFDIRNSFSKELYWLLLGCRPYTGTLFIDGSVIHPEKKPGIAGDQIAVTDGAIYRKMIFRELSTNENIVLSAWRRVTAGVFFISGRSLKYLQEEGSRIQQKYHLSKDPHKFSRQEDVILLYNRILLSKPRLLYCYRPFLRLDAVGRSILENLFQEFCRIGTALVLSSATLSDLQTVCDRILIVENNRIQRTLQKGIDY